jgi:diguanylate cyclase (GGDEF)-like protein
MEFPHSGNDRDMETRMLRIANALQSSLDTHRLLEIFSDEISSAVPHDGLDYWHPEDNIAVSIGHRERHACTYQIILLEKPEGEITLTRKRMFLPKETRLLETLLCALVYPLRNAVLYKRALETAFKDPVTGINNRAAMDTAIRREVELSRRHNTSLSLIMLDIDKFKAVNDTYGHLAGDALLKGLAQCLQECIRGTDLVFRYGGEEFAIVLSSTDLPGAQLLAERIRRAVEQREFPLDKRAIKITVSVGVACLSPSDDMPILIGRADRALYQAKAEGRNRVIIENS